MEITKELIEQLIGEKISAQNASTFTGFSAEMLRRKAREFQTPFAKFGIANNMADKLCDETCEAYYWAGLMLADGTFNFKDKSIRLALTDKLTVKWFKIFIETSSKITKTTFPDKSWNPLYTVKMGAARHFFEITDKFGIKPAKTYNPPDKLPTENAEFLTALLVGLIDGDGTVGCIKHTTVDGRKTERFRATIDSHYSWEKFFRLLSVGVAPVLGYEPPVSTTPDNEARIFVGRQESMKKLVSFILAKNLPVMPRKLLKIPI